MRRTLAVVAVVAALTVSAQPAAAATFPASDWLRACSTTKSHPLKAACTVTPPIIGHTLTYADESGVQHTLSTPGSVWAFATAHSRKCVIRKHDRPAQLACYTHDELSHARAITLASGISVLVSRFDGH